MCDIKQSCSGGAEGRKTETAARGWTISLVPVSRACEESKLWASLFAE